MPPQAPPIERREGPTRERLINRAAELFARHGFAPIGLDRIISDVGVTKTTFYNHFASKDDLVIAVLAHQHEIETTELLSDIETRAGADHRARILAFFDVFHDWFHDPEFNGCIFMNAASEYPIETDPVHKAAVHHGDELQRLITEECRAAGIGEADAPSIGSQITLLLMGALIMRHAAKRKDAAALAKMTAEALLNTRLSPTG